MPAASDAHKMFATLRQIVASLDKLHAAVDGMSARLAALELAFGDSSSESEESEEEEGEDEEDSDDRDFIDDGSEAGKEDEDEDEEDESESESTMQDE